MKKFQKYGLMSAAAMAVLYVGGTASLTKSLPARAPASNEFQSTSADDAGIVLEEDLREDQKKRKAEVCGEKSLTLDTITNYDQQRTDWFPGRAQVLADPHEALLAKLILIQKAKKSIDISTYIFSNDESSRAILDALVAAVNRGVNVRFMVDCGGSLGEALKDQYRHLRTLLMGRKMAEKVGFHPGTVDVVVFHPIARARTLTTWTSEQISKLFTDVDASSETALNFDRRSHDKIFMIDREDRASTVAIVGGRNIDNSYYGWPKVDQNTYEDMELIVMNDEKSNDPRTIASTLGRHYQNLFCSRGNRWLSLERIGKHLDGTELEYMGDMPSRLAFLDVQGGFDVLLRNPELASTYSKMRGKTGYDFLKGLARSKIMPGNEIQNLRRTIHDVIVDPDAPFADKMFNGDSIYYQVRRLIGNAERSVDLCTPYIFLPKNERDCLKKWAMEKPGRKVRILSNSSATSDSALAMTTFDHESAPEAIRDGHYRCEDPKTHEVSEGEFDNRDGKIEVYELGRLDNVTFTKAPIHDSKGERIEPSAFYGKLHAKFGIVDGHYLFIGSHNLDERSRRLNSETAFFVDNKKVAADLTHEFDKLVARSYKYGDPDLEIMDDRPELKSRRKMMTILDYINKHFPQAGFAN